jgi:CBS domain containing-hemolysin-like protein
MEQFDGRIPAEILEEIANCDHSGMSIYQDKDWCIGICPVCGLYCEISRDYIDEVFRHV